MIHSTIPNPINIEIEQTATQIQKKLAELKEESDKWDELLQHHTEQAQEEER